MPVHVVKKCVSRRAKNLAKQPVKKRRNASLRTKDHISQPGKKRDSPEANFLAPAFPGIEAACGFGIEHPSIATYTTKTQAFPWFY